MIANVYVMLQIRAGEEVAMWAVPAPSVEWAETELRLQDGIEPEDRFEYVRLIERTLKHERKERIKWRQNQSA